MRWFVLSVLFNLPVAGVWSVVGLLAVLVAVLALRSRQEHWHDAYLAATDRADNAEAEALVARGRCKELQARLAQAEQRAALWQQRARGGGERRRCRT